MFKDLREHASWHAKCHITLKISKKFNNTAFFNQIEEYTKLKICIRDFALGLKIILRIYILFFRTLSFTVLVKKPINSPEKEIIRNLTNDHIPKNSDNEVSRS